MDAMPTSAAAESFFSDELITFNIFFSNAVLSNVDVTCGVCIDLATLSPGGFFCDVLAALILQLSIDNMIRNKGRGISLERFELNFTSGQESRGCRMFVISCTLLHEAIADSHTLERKRLGKDCYVVITGKDAITTMFQTYILSCPFASRRSV